MYPDPSEAGPSRSIRNRFLLGPPISPTFNSSRRSLSFVQESDEEWDESDDEELGSGLDLTRQFPLTPIPIASLPVTPPRPSRRSLVPPLSINPSEGAESSDLAPTQRESTTRRTSNSSSQSIPRNSSPIPFIDTASSSPGDDYRSRVSLDATPVPPNISEFSSNSDNPNLPSLLETARSRTSESSTAQEETIVNAGYSTSVKPRNSKKRARFLEAADMSRSDDQATSSDTNRSRRSYMSAFAGEELGEDWREPVDEAIRSVPGVIGLGEGWAGGPQRKESKSWFRRRASIEDDDPLALWSQGDEKEAHTTTPSSPLRNMWNRSKRNLFGSSTTALADQERGETMAVEGSPSRLRGLLNNLSRSNLTSPEVPPLIRRRSNLTKSKSKRFSLGVFSTSAVTLTDSTKKPAIPPSPSMSILPTTESLATRRPQQYGGSSFARSEGSLTKGTGPDLPVPQRSSSLSRREGRQGLPPPWRPNSLLLAGRPQTPHIPEMEETIRESISSTSLRTPEIRESEILQSPNPGHTLTRTATFGVEDIASEQRIDDDRDLTPPSPIPAKTRSWVSSHQAQLGISGNDRSPAQRPVSPQRRPSLGKRGASLFKKMRNVLPLSFLRTDSETALRSRQSLRRPGNKTSTPISFSTVDSSIGSTLSSRSVSGSTSAATSISGDFRMEPVKFPTSGAPSNKATKHRRRSSWMIRSSSSLAQRLSKLTEQDEVESISGDRKLEREDKAARNLRFGAEEEHGAKKGVSHHRHRSMNLANWTMGSKRSTGSRPLDDIRHLPASASMPALHRYDSSELNLHVDLEGEALGLEDILDQRKRNVIIRQLELDQDHDGRETPRTREEAIEATSAALEGTHRPGSPKRSGHLKTASEPNAQCMLDSAQHGDNSSVISGRTRRKSLTLPVHPRELRSGATMTKKSTGRHPSFSSVTSSPASTLTTPRHPPDLATFLHALTFEEDNDDTNASGSGSNSQSQHHRLSLSASHARRSMSNGSKDQERFYNYPWGASASTISLHNPGPSNGGNGNGGLQVPKRSSIATTRMSMDSYITQPSLYDAEDVVESHAIKVTSLSDMHRHASVISMGELTTRGV